MVGKNGRYLSIHEVARYELLKQVLGFTSREFCAQAEVNPGSFSQMVGSGSGKRLRLNDRVRSSLETFLVDRLAKCVGINDAQREELSGYIDEICGIRKYVLPTGQAYYEPGAYLPVDAYNYVHRSVDDGLLRNSHSRSHFQCIVGGAGTGKTSLVYRLREVLLTDVRTVHFGEVQTFFGSSSQWPEKKLTRAQVWLAFGYALGQNDDFLKVDQTLSSERFHRAFEQVFYRVARSSRAVWIVDDFIELVMRADNLDDVVHLVYFLSSTPYRSDDNLIVITDNGIVSSDMYVAQEIERSAPLRCGRLDSADITYLYRQVLGVDPPGYFVRFAAQQMFETFGNCLFLHHVVLHEMRECLAETPEVPDYGVVTQAIKQVLSKLTESASVKNCDPRDRQLQRFADRVRADLRLLERVTSVSWSDVKGGLAASTDQRVRHFLEISGYFGLSSSPPEYLKVIWENL